MQLVEAASFPAHPVLFVIARALELAFDHQGRVAVEKATDREQAPSPPPCPSGVGRGVVLPEPSAKIAGEAGVDLPALGEQEINVKSGQASHQPAAGPS
jgi:hypothetical protein